MDKTHFLSACVSLIMSVGTNKDDKQDSLVTKLQLPYMDKHRALKDADSDQALNLHTMFTLATHNTLAI